MALLIRQDGSLEQVQPKNGTDFKLKDEVYGLLECDTVEVIHLGEIRLKALLSRGVKSPAIMLIDEEGKMNARKLVNLSATLAAKRIIQPGDCIVGHALICGEEELL